jgi:hypothetical protein
MVLYLLSAVYAACVGVVLAYRSHPTDRALGAVGLALIGVFVVVAFLEAPRLPLLGPLFAVVSIVTSVVVQAHRLREHPALAGEPYRRRVLIGESAVALYERAERERQVQEPGTR